MRKIIICFAAACIIMSGCSGNNSRIDEMQKKIDSLQSQLDEKEAPKESVTVENVEITEKQETTETSGIPESTQKQGTIDVDNFLDLFTQNEPNTNYSPLSDFEYEDNDAGIVIKKYIGASQEVIIPQKINGKNVTKIDYYAFAFCNDITSVIIPNSVEEIGIQSFCYCENLENIVISTRIKELGDYAFEHTPWFENKRKEGKFVIVDGISIDGTKASGDIVIPDNVTMIGSSAFRGNTDIISVKIPKKTTKICHHAFMDCENLNTVVIPDSVTEIGRDVFLNTLWLENKREENPFVIINDILIDGTSVRSDTVIIPDKVITINQNAFSGCAKIKKIIIPNSVTEIGNNAFFNSSLESIIIPDSVTKIGEGAFWWCMSLTDIKLPTNINKINGFTFWGCISLNNLDIPEGVDEIGLLAFESCNNLVNVIIPDSVKKINEQAFNYCENIKASYKGKIYDYIQINDLYSAINE